jgi:hypothetical protein
MNTHGCARGTSDSVNCRAFSSNFDYPFLIVVVDAARVAAWFSPATLAG